MVLKRKKLFNILKIFAVTLVLVSFQSCVYADTFDPPTLEQSKEKIARTLNIVFMSVALVFVTVVAYGVVKASLASGDPRGLEGAKQTWQYALYGFIVVVIFFGIFALAQRLLGIPVLTPGGLLDGLYDALYGLVNVSKSSGEVSEFTDPNLWEPGPKPIPLPN